MQVSVDVSATGFSGVLMEQMAKVGDTVGVGAPLAVFDTDAEGAKPPPPPKEEAKPAKEEPKEIPKQERKEEPKKTQPPPPPQEPPRKAAAPQPPASTAPPTKEPTPQPGSRGQRRVKMTRLRLRIAERLVSAQSNGALLTT